MNEALKKRCEMVARRIAKQFLAVGPGDVVLLCWAEYADDIFVPLRIALQELGVAVVTQRWDDHRLLSVLQRWPLDEIIRLWQPVEPDGSIRIPQNRELRANRVVSLWSPAVSEHVDQQAAVAGLGAAVRQTVFSLAQLGDSAAILTLLEWPRGARKDTTMDLGRDDVIGFYLDAMDQDPDDVHDLNRTVLGLIGDGTQVRLRCPLGTDLIMDTKGRKWREESMTAGRSAGPLYLPGGEVYVAVNEISAQGNLMFYSSGYLCSLEIKDGFPVTLTTPLRSLTKSLTGQLSVGCEPVSELGIGTNPRATPLQVGALCEKAFGTVHVAVGANQHLGGQHTSSTHIDLLVRSPTLDIGNVRILSEGKCERVSGNR